MIRKCIIPVLILIFLFSCKKNNAAGNTEKSAGEKETSAEKMSEADFAKAIDQQLDYIKGLTGYYIQGEDVIFVTTEDNAIAVKYFNTVNNETVFNDMAVFPFDGFDGKKRFTNGGNYFEVDGKAFRFTCDENPIAWGKSYSSSDKFQQEITGEMLKLTYDYQVQYRGTYQYVSYELDNADINDIKEPNDISYIIAINEYGYLTMTDNTSNKYEGIFKIIDDYADIADYAPVDNNSKIKIYFSGSRIIYEYKFDSYSGTEGTSYKKGYKLIYEKIGTDAPAEK